MDETKRYRYVMRLIDETKDPHCVACGTNWGYHYGINCPGSQTTFLHRTEVEVSKNPNLQFKLRKARATR